MPYEGGEITHGLDRRTIASTKYEVIGQGREFEVIRPESDPGFVYKVPLEKNAWANSSVSPVEYQVGMYDRLIQLGFREFLPRTYEAHNSPAHGQVIRSEDLSEGGKNLVLACEGLDNVNNPKLLEMLGKFPVDPELIQQEIRRVRKEILGIGTEGLIDQAGVKNIIIPVDSYQIIIHADGSIRTIINDLGTVVEKPELDYNRVNTMNYSFTTGLLAKLSTLKWIYENKK
jgi:hypothetical protein